MIVFDRLNYAVIMRIVTSAQLEDHMDRSQIARCLAKAIAYKQCGKHEAAETWAVELLLLLDCANILPSDVRETILNRSIAA